MDSRVGGVVGVREVGGEGGGVGELRRGDMGKVGSSGGNGEA